MHVCSQSNVNKKVKAYIYIPPEMSVKIIQICDSYVLYYNHSKTVHTVVYLHQYSD